MCEVNAPALDYDVLRESLDHAGFVLALPELHGGICGVLCSGGDGATQRWIEECIVEYANPLDQTNLSDLKRTLYEPVLVTQQMLASSQFEFEPLLPDEEAPLDEQVQALALWCHGFLSGLGFGAGTAAESLDGSLTEILEDFAEISRAGLSGEDREDPDQADFALAQLKEYVRVSVQIVFEELAAQHAVASTDSTH
jgi:hypothetical protein